MKYLSVEPMTLPVEMTLDDEESLASLASFCDFMLRGYQSSPVLVLQVPDLRVLNKAVDKFQDGPERGYYGLEDEEVRVTRTIIETLGPHILKIHARNLPVILDLLDAAPDKHPMRDTENGADRLGAVEVG